MEQLSSCYFCGAALDAQIEPYQVVPPQLEPSDDQQRAVSLCPTCRKKLGHVVETVVTATDEGTAPTVDDVSAPEPSGDLLRNETVDTTADITVDTAGDERASGKPLADDRAPDRSDQWEPPVDDPESDTSGDTDTGSRETVGTIERTRSNGTDTHSDRSSSHSNSPQPDPHGNNDRSGSQSEHQPTDQTGRQSGGRGAPASGSENQQTDSAADPAGEDDGPSLTALEYNKVMRLLQNRDFPVERAEIHDVATSAYQISDREFDAIIDAAIQRGLLGEENGQLVSGD